MITARSLALVAVLGATACERRRPPPAAADVLGALPATTDAVVRISLADLRGSPVWPLVERVLADQRPLFDMIERACGLRVLDVVDAVTVAGDGVHPGLSLAIIEGRFTALKAEDCFARAMAADREAKVDVRVAGGITELSAAGFAEKVHVRWLRDGAVLVPFAAPTDRARLEQALAGPRLASGRLATELRATAGAAIRVAAIGDEQRGPARLMEPLAALTGPVPPLGARAAVKLETDLAIEVRLSFANETQARGAAAAARLAVAGFADQPGAGAFAPLAGATSIEAEGAQVVVRAALGGAALPALIDELTAGLTAP